MFLQEVSGGSAPKLETDTDADSVVGTDYDVRVVMDGGRLQVWRGKAGQTKELVLEGTTTVLAGDYQRFKLGEQVTAELPAPVRRRRTGA